MGKSARKWFAPRALLLSLCITSSLGHIFDNEPNHGSLSSQWQRLSARQQSDNVAPGVNLRVMAIGDSITDGGAPDKGNSYRKLLRKALIKDTSRTVDFVGSRSNGEGNPDNQHEGYGGLRISEIQARLIAGGALAQRPNLVLIHAGTNDFLQDNSPEPFDRAPERLGALIEKVLCTCPDAVVLVAKIIKSDITGKQARHDVFNNRVLETANGFTSKGYKVCVVDHSSIGGSNLADGIHPNEVGYAAMAGFWIGALGQLPNGYITPPQQGAGSSTAPTTSSPGKGVQTCKRDKWAWISVNGDKEICPGASVPGDQGFKAPVKVATGGIAKSGAGLTFGDLNGDGKDDLLYIDSDGKVIAYLNKGINSWETVNNGMPIAEGIGARQGIRFADMTGDKKDDIVVFRPDGTMAVYRNEGPFGVSWFWKELSVYGPGGTNSGNDLLGDLNGDGKADVAVIQFDGSISLHIQQGEIGSGSFTWKTYLLSIYSDGGIKGWLNKPGGECDVTWQPIQNDKGMEKAIANGAGGPSSRIRLADLTGDGKADYVVIDEANSVVEMFENTGLTLPGASKAVLYGLGAAVRLADLDGDGTDDYISVGPIGEVVAFRNAGQQVDDKTGAITWSRNKGPYGEDSWLWTPPTQIASGVGPGAGARFADINGDGRADFIHVDEKGDATIFPNNGVTRDQFNGWGQLNNGKPAAQGVNAKREEVYFADMDGDGFADYVRVYAETGAMEVFYGAPPLSGPGWNWSPPARKADGAGYQDKHVRLARMTRSGRPDYVVVEEKTGALKMFENYCSEQISSGGGSNGGSGPPPTTGCGTPPLPSRTKPELVPTGVGPPQESPVVRLTDSNLIKYNLRVINATPYAMRRDFYGDPYRMWGFKEVWPETILPGETLIVTYGTMHGQDDAGDIKYKLDINGKREKAFHLQVHGKRDGGNSGIETRAAVYGGLALAGHPSNAELWPIGLYYHDGIGDEGGMDSFIISGNEQDGYYSTDPPTAWMNVMGPHLRQLSLHQIILPGSHDAGTWKITHLGGGTSDNSVTQSEDIHTQLVRGIRALDFRVYWFKDAYWLGHGTKAGHILGGSLEEVIENINRFRRENPGELIYIQINLMAKGGAGQYQDFMGVEEAKGCFSDISGEPLQTFYRSSTSPVLIDIKDEFIRSLAQDIVGLRIKDGRTTGMLANATLPKSGEYAESPDWNVMRQDQLRKLKGKAFDPNHNWSRDKIFQTSMTLTLKNEQNLGGPVSIRKLAQLAHGVIWENLFRWVKENGRHPNLVWFDFVDDRQMAGIAMAINYQFAFRDGNLF
ncbi:hypothetical protein EJ08DRAFT_702550 [Tothia fuscella]|uniref:SGNH hydrolase-type esterase domain-containing protein n=1 Tax=Tothia fuscella TaxID=1048955 RepID=A0A9P4NGK0_9PEZI|nr:hypothetical protein EJ08DRAFT_702550 [Tothia fuscella]